MRSALTFLALGALLAAAGCEHSRWGILNWRDKKVEPARTPPPTTAALVSYLNQNAQLLQTLRCDDMRVDVKHGLKPAIGLDAQMIAQQPRNFRMRAKFSGSTEVDMGSNQEEFWYWIRRGPNAQIYCKYKDLEAGLVGEDVAIPFQPEWVLETMGMSDFGPPERYQLVEDGDKLKLIEKTKSPQGKPVRKVIVLNRRQVPVPTPQVTNYILIDETTNKEICSAEVREVQLATSGTMLAKLPRRVDLHWPEERLTLTLTLDRAEADVNIPPGFPAFVRQPLSGIPSFDLARRQFDGQTSSIQRTRGEMANR